MELKSLIEKELKKEDVSEITFISLHGIETKVNKTDRLEEENGFLYIIRENGEIEIIVFTDNIFKIIIKKIHSITVKDIYVA